MRPVTDEGASTVAIRFMETLHVPQGPRAGQALKLAPFLKASVVLYVPSGLSHPKQDLVWGNCCVTRGVTHSAEQRRELIKEQGLPKSLPDTASSETSDEVRELAAELLRKRKAGPKGAPLKLRMDETGTIHIGYRHSDETLGGVLLMADIGSASTAFFSGLTAQIAVLGSYGKRVGEENSNFVLSVVQTVKPQDEVEAMLAA